MKKFFLFISATIIVIAGTSFFIVNRNHGKIAPVPEIFAKNIVSTQDDEFGETFSPDGHTCYFSKKSPSTLQSNIYIICFSQFKNGKWNEPEIAPFSGKFKDFHPSISPDGSKLFFISNRTDSSKKTTDTDIWMVRKKESGWTEPENIGPVVNSKGYELGCSVAADGTLYFSSTGTSGNADLYCSKFINGKYQKPDSLGEAVNSIYNEADPFIAPDESYIIFSSEGRPDATPAGAGASAGYQRSDLYISFHKNGKWTKANKLGPLVNTAAAESSPFVSRDGKTFYYISEKNFISLPMKSKLEYSFLEDHLHGPGNGLGDIYQVPLSAVLKDLK